MFTPKWTTLSSPRQAPSLSHRAVDVWLIDLDRESAAIQFLDEEERTRAARFVFERDSRRFAVARGALRFLLGEYLNLAPDEIEFAYGPFGKPELRQAGAPAFNLAHSAGVGLIAVGGVTSLGVDVEITRPVEDWADIAAQTFAPGETRSVLAMPSADQMAGFFTCWTRKEAVIKLWGDGFSADLTSFEVSTDPDGPARILSLARTGTKPDSIRLWGFKVAAGVLAALAVITSAEEIDLRFWCLCQ